MLSQHAFVQEPVYLWMGGSKKEKIDTSLPQSWSFQEIFSRVNGLFTLLLHLPTLFCNRTLHLDPDKIAILRHCYLLRLPAFQIKSYSLPQHLIYRLIGLLCGEQSKLGLYDMSILKIVI